MESIEKHLDFHAVNTVKKGLIRKAQEAHPGLKLFPCSGYESLWDCFSVLPEDGYVRITFWFNQEGNGTTKALSENLECLNATADMLDCLI